MSGIFGTPVSVNLRKPDLTQVDPKKGDFVYGKEEFLEQVNQGSGGADGFSPVAKVTQTESGATITITDKSGTTTATVTNGKDGKDGIDGQPGEPGKDYVLTEADKSEIAEQVRESISGGLVLADTATGNQYSLYVDNGKLKMEEV